MTRLSLVAGCAALPLSLPLTALAQDDDPSGRRYLLSGAQVITMQGGWTPPAPLDILIEDGKIARIDADIEAADATEIDLSGHLLTPGLVDSHWHMWNTIARGYERSDQGGFAGTMKPLSGAWTPEASALSVELGMALAVNSGITYVNNWAHNVKAPEFADAEIAAMAASGVRGRFSYGYPQALGQGALMDLADLETTQSDWPEDSLIGLGVSLRGPDRSTPEIWTQEITKARDLGLPVTFHMGGAPEAAEKHNVAALAEQKMLGKDIHVVHMTSAPEEDLRKLAEGGSPLIISPWTELEVGYGVPDPGMMKDAGLEMAVSVDNTVLAGQINMFEVMRLTADLADGHAHKQQALPDADVFDWATRQGARSIMAPEGVGTLTEGGPADLIAISTEGLNTRPAASPDFLLTHAAEPEDVSFVMIAGEIHKENGKLIRVDLGDLTARADAMMGDLAAQAGVQ
ncbi:amidohydrolase family protein [Thioclava kandeliae]|uniref:Amidohydrolase family protein n=1 Tax=Thioclava kandeliae TaxID=3070818 RepID=A0ABV1SGD1_9RHOB